MLEGVSMLPDLGSAGVPFFGRRHAELMVRFGHLALLGCFPLGRMGSFFGII